MRRFDLHTTRAEWEATADRWIAGAQAYASPRGALLAIPGRHAWSGPDSDALEGYARSFLLAACRVAGGDRPDLAQRYAEGLAAGTEPGGAEEWLRGVDCVLPLTGRTQPIVEAANIAFALHISRDQVWGRLSDSEREQVADWLAHHARLVTWPNNWVLFTAVIEAFLSSVGVDTSDYRSDHLVRWTESWHLGGGWYTDGSRRNVDYYNAWVIHPFLWAWYDMVGDRDPDAAWRWRQRLRDFVRDYPKLFGGNGSPVQQGRSLTYRTAALAPLWLAELTGTAGISAGRTRVIAGSVLRYFVDAGAGGDGPLSLGWLAEQYLPLTQSYSGPGSPYFAAMGFLGLLLPPDHEVWTAPEDASSVDAVTALPGPGWLVTATGDGIVRVANHGSDHITPGTPEPDPQYIKLAYSSHTSCGYDEAFTDGVDNEFTLIGPAARYRRLGIAEHHCAGTVATSVNRYEPGPVTSTTAAWRHLEARVHRAPTGFGAGEGGYLLADPIDSGVLDGDHPGAWVRDASGCVSFVAGLHGWSGARVHEYGAVTPLGATAAVPALASSTSGLHVSVHALTTMDVADLLEQLDAIQFAADRSTVTWPDGGTAHFAVS